MSWVRSGRYLGSEDLEELVPKKTYFGSKELSIHLAYVLRFCLVVRILRFTYFALIESDGVVHTPTRLTKCKHRLGYIL